MPKVNKTWQPIEEEFFEKAWQSGKYGKDDLIRVFGRSWNSLVNKAGRIGLPNWGEIEARVRLAAIEKMLKEDHII